MQIADMICGNYPPESRLFIYRKSSLLTEFFSDAETDYEHDGSTRQYWVADTLEKILEEPQTDARKVPPTFGLVIQLLMDPADAVNEDEQRTGALAMLNASLAREGFEAYYTTDKQLPAAHCHQHDLGP